MSIRNEAGSGIAVVTYVIIRREMRDEGRRYAGGSASGAMTWALGDHVSVTEDLDSNPDGC